jgi:hypothetical protein
MAAVRKDAAAGGRRCGRAQREICGGADDMPGQTTGNAQSAGGAVQERADLGPT